MGYEAMEEQRHLVRREALRKFALSASKVKLLVEAQLLTISRSVMRGTSIAVESQSCISSCA